MLFFTAPAVLVIDKVNVGKRSITFNWNDTLGSKGAKYSIEYKVYDAEGRQKTVRLTAYKPSIVIKGLTPYTEYSFDLNREGAVAGTGVTLKRRTLSAGKSYTDCSCSGVSCVQAKHI